MNIIYGTNNRPNENLQKVLDTAGINSSGANWNTVAPNTSGQTGSLNVPFLNEYANRKTTTNAVQTPPPPSSPGADTGLSIYNVPVDPYQAEYDRYSQMHKNDADQVIDQDKIYRDKLRMHQAEIDAVNQIYINQLASARQEGLGRLGSTTAASARSGTLGSDFGFAQQNEMQGYNRGIEQGIQAEQAAKIGAIMGAVRSGVADEIAAKTQAKQAGAQNYLEYLKGASERRTTRTAALVDQLLTSETDPETVDWDTTLKGSNLNKDEIMTAYKKAKQEQDYRIQEAQAKQAEAQRKADLEERTISDKEMKTSAEIKKIEADIAKGKVISLGEGSMLFNLETGETFKNPKTYAPRTTSSGGTSTPVEKTDAYGTARQFIKDNPGASQEEIRAGLLENAKALGLTVTDINGLIAEANVPKRAEMLDLTPQKISTLAVTLRKKFAKLGTSSSDELENAKQYIKGGQITSGGTKYKLTENQINQIIAELDKIGERTIMQRVLPGGA